MPEKHQFVVGGLVRCLRAHDACGLLAVGTVYTVAKVGAGAGSLELKEVPFPNARGLKFWDYTRFEPYYGMDSTEYDDTLAGQAIYRDLEGGE